MVYTIVETEYIQWVPVNYTPQWMNWVPVYVVMVTDYILVLVYTAVETEYTQWVLAKWIVGVQNIIYFLHGCFVSMDNIVPVVRQLRS